MRNLWWKKSVNDKENLRNYNHALDIRCAVDMKSEKVFNKKLSEGVW